MSDFEMDDSQIADFINDLDLLQQEFPREARAVMRGVGNKAKAKVRSVATSSIVEDTGNYLRAITRGKVWSDDGNTYNVRVYPKNSIAPHAHLIEFGWIHTGHEPNKKQGKFIPGFHIYEHATQQFESEFYSTMEQQFSKIVDKLP